MAFQIERNSLPNRITRYALVLSDNVDYTSENDPHSMWIIFHTNMQKPKVAQWHGT